MKDKILGSVILVFLALVSYWIFHMIRKLKSNEKENNNPYALVLNKNDSLNYYNYNDVDCITTSSNGKYALSFDGNGIYIKNDTNWRCKDFEEETTSIDNISLNDNGDLIVNFRTNDYWKWKEDGEKYMFHEVIKPIYLYRNTSSIINTDESVRLVLDDAGYLLIIKYSDDKYDKKGNALWVSNLEDCQKKYNEITERREKDELNKAEWELKQKEIEEKKNNSLRGFYEGPIAIAGTAGGRMSITINSNHGIKLHQRILMFNGEVKTNMEYGTLQELESIDSGYVGKIVGKNFKYSFSLEKENLEILGTAWRAKLKKDSEQSREVD